MRHTCVLPQDTLLTTPARSPTRCSAPPPLSPSSLRSSLDGESAAPGTLARGLGDPLGGLTPSQVIGPVRDAPAPGSLQAAGKLEDLTGIGFFEGYFTDEPFYVANLFYKMGERVVQVLVKYEMAHKIKPLLNTVCIEKREYEPAFHEARTHRCVRMVNGLQQVGALLVTAVYEFQVADGEAVHP